MDLRRLLAAALGELALLLVLAGPAAAAQAPAPGWSWPLAPRPAVLARFARPPGPYSPGHRGVDLAALPGARVLAAAAGVVAFAGRVAGRGVVSVDHPGGLRTTYEPVTATVSRGDQVATGAVLGVLEAAGSHCPPATCLHWGLRRGDDYLDPLTLLGPVRVRLLPVWGAAGALAGGGTPITPASAPRAALQRSTRPGRGPPAGTRTVAALVAGSLLAAGSVLAAGRVVPVRLVPVRVVPGVPGVPGVRQRRTGQSSDGRSAANLR